SILSRSSMPGSVLQQRRTKSPIAPRCAVVRPDVSSLFGLPPPLGAPPACGLARAFGGWVCFCRLRSFSSVLSSAVLCGAGFFVGFGCEVALGGLGGGGAGGGGNGRGVVGSGGCTCGGLGGAAGGG